MVFLDTGRGSLYHKGGIAIVLFLKYRIAGLVNISFAAFRCEHY